LAAREDLHVPRDLVVETPPVRKVGAVGKAAGSPDIAGRRRIASRQLCEEEVRMTDGEGAIVLAKLVQKLRLPFSDFVPQQLGDIGMLPRYVPFLPWVGLHVEQLALMVQAVLLRAYAHPAVPM